MLGQNTTGWGSCSSCTGTTYVDSSGNATGNGTTTVTPATGPSGVPLGTGSNCTISGWLIAAGIGILVLMGVTAGPAQQSRHHTPKS